MVVKPRPWHNDNLISSAYLSNNVLPYKLIKRAKMNYISEMENTDISVTLKAVNALQETPWRIHRDMLEVLQFAYDNSLQLDKLPPANDLPYPPRVHEEATDAEKKENGAAYAHVHTQNRKFISQRLAVLQVLNLANKFKDFNELYFPHDLCSRGRAYPKPHYLNPQGPSYVRSLLEFSEGKPVMTVEQVEYICIIGANAYGNDKLPLSERIDWAWENEEMFVEIANNWKTDKRWQQADAPFEFLRFCFEWRDMDEFGGQGYISHLPINLDATCSGLQHFSALLKDQEGGFNVNLTKHDERQDVYAEVARKAKASIEADLYDPEKAVLAQAALDLGVDRKLCKRPVMIVPYSGTFKACMKYVQEYYEDLVDAGVAMPLSGFDVDFRLVPYVARKVWDSIDLNVVAAREAMDFITKVARLVTKNEDPLPFMWSTPTGFVVQQAKYKMDNHRVSTKLDGSHLWVEYLTDSKELDTNKNAQSLSPNYIHSMDAAHLQLTINKALEKADMSFCMIHDSFGVHAADMPVFLNDCIKPAFYEMYEDGTALQKFLDEVMPLIPEKHREKIPPLPTLGSLDLSEVLESEFFFS